MKDDDDQGTLFPDKEVKPPTCEPDASIDTVRRGVGEQWIRLVLSHIRSMPRGKKFSTDELWPLVGDVREPRAMGAAIRDAAKKGLCSTTGEYHKSKRPECHKRPVAIWRRS